MTADPEVLDVCLNESHMDCNPTGWERMLAAGVLAVIIGARLLYAWLPLRPRVPARSRGHSESGPRLVNRNLPLTDDLPVRAEWYGAWQAVFRVDRDNATDPSLAEWHADGNLYTFIHGIEASEPDYRTRAPIIRERVTQMFDAAGTSARSEQISAFIGMVRGGRTDDLERAINRIKSDKSGAQKSRLDQNKIGDSEGIASLIRQVNEGDRPAIVSAEPVLDATQRIAGDYRSWRPWLGVSAIVCLGAGLFVPGRHRIVAIAVLTMLAGVWGVLASAYIDNARYLVGPMIVSLVTGMLCIEALAMRTSTKSTPDALEENQARQPDD